MGAFKGASIAAGRNGFFYYTGSTDIASTLAIGFANRDPDAYLFGVDYGMAVVPGEIAFNPSVSSRAVASATTPDDGALRLYYMAGSGGGVQHRRITDPLGTVWALPDGISIAPNGRNNILAEIRPSAGARHILLVSFLPNQLSQATVTKFALAAGDCVLDRQPTPDGGFLILTGAETSASVSYLSPAGVLNGPFPIGPASQVAYSDVSGGQVLTAGRTASGSLFVTRGPLTAPFTQSSTTPFPYANLSFSLTCAAARASEWWIGGSYTTPAGNKNGFVAAVENSPALGISKETIVGATAEDEQVYSLEIEPAGVGVVGADGVLQAFDSITGEILASYPGSPNPAIQFREVASQPVSYVFDSFLLASAYSHFGVISYDSSADDSALTIVSLPGVLKRAATALPVNIGGTSPTLYAELYERSASAKTFSLSSNNPAVQVPPTISFGAGATVASVSLQTQPVSTSQDVVITVGSSPRRVLAKLTLRAPAPYFFTPNSVSVTGGQSGVLRLSLTGKAPTGGLTVPLQSSGSPLLVPTSVVIPQGLYSRSFVFGTTTVASSVTRTVTATYESVTSTANVTVNP